MRLYGEYVNNGLRARRIKEFRLKQNIFRDDPHTCRHRSPLNIRLLLRLLNKKSIAGETKEEERPIVRDHPLGKRYDLSP